MKDTANQYSESFGYEYDLVQMLLEHEGQPNFGREKNIYLLLEKLKYRMEKCTVYDNNKQLCNNAGFSLH